MNTVEILNICPDAKTHPTIPLSDIFDEFNRMVDARGVVEHEERLTDWYNGYITCLVRLADKHFDADLVGLATNGRLKRWKGKSK